MQARFDRDNCGNIDAQEFHAVLNWQLSCGFSGADDFSSSMLCWDPLTSVCRLGYAMTLEDLLPIMKDSNVKLTGVMNHREYLRCALACKSANKVCVS